jgi:hypothetical protein
MPAWRRLVHLLLGALLTRGSCIMCKVGERVPLSGPVADIYKAVAELTKRYPGRPFTPDGHLVGSIGEVIAKEALVMALNWFAPPLLLMTLLAQYVVRYRSKSRRVKQLRGPSDGLWESAGPTRSMGNAL